MAVERVIVGTAPTALLLLPGRHRLQNVDPRSTVYFTAVADTDPAPQESDPSFELGPGAHTIFSFFADERGWVWTRSGAPATLITRRES